MSQPNLPSDRGVARSALDVTVYGLAVVLTAYTVLYAVALVLGWPLTGIVSQPRWVIRDDLYVILFFGIGLALYYLDYATNQFDGTGGFAAADTGDEPATATAPAESSRPSSDRGSTTDAADREPETALERARRFYETIDPYIAIGLAVVALVATYYIYTNFERLEGDAFIAGYNAWDHRVGAVLIALAIDATRRAFGVAIPAVAVASIAYAHAWVGPNLPGVFRHSGDTWTQIVESGAVNISGVYHGTLMGIGSTWVAIFIMFAGIAKAFGLMEFVREVGQELGRSLRTGVVQIAVISSMIMGSITGSAAAHTATTGSFTIPMIKDQGVRDDVAASIEAVASAGGQMLPPVMGVAAFLMADLLQVPYLSIVRAGVIPAALFYLSVCVAVHFTVLKFGWTSSDLTPFDWGLLLKGVHFAVPMAVLLYTLVVLQYSPFAAGMYTIFTIIGVMFVRNPIVDLLLREADDGSSTIETDGLSPNELGRSLFGTVEQTLDGFRQGGTDMAPLVGVLAAMGVIIELLIQTGLTARVATKITGLGDVTLLGVGGGLFVVLFLAMFASILFGLGMPTPAAYILVAVLVARPVTEMGTPPITTHMFVFYFAMLSAITPPVAVSVAIGARIAGASFMRAGVQALRLGAPGFVIPYAFVANNSLIYWSFPETLIAFPVVLAGTIGLIVATVGFDGARDLSAPLRALYVLVAGCAMFGSLVHVGLQLVAAALIIGALIHARYVVGYQPGVAAGADQPSID